MKRNNPTAGQSGKILSPRSSVWQFMELNRETRRARCRFCEKILAYTGGTTNLRYHLTSAHAMEEFEVIGPSAKVFKGGLSPKPAKKKPGRKLKIPSTESHVNSFSPTPAAPSTPNSTKVSTVPVDTASAFTQSIQDVPFAKRVSFTPLKTVSHQMKSEDRDVNISFRLLQMVIQSLQPLDLVECEGFKKFMKFLEPSYKLPGKKVLQNNLLAMYEEAKVKLKEVLNRDVQHYALVYDIWKAGDQQMQTTVMIHYLTNQWERKSYVLGTEQIYNVKSSYVEISNIIRQLMFQYNLATDRLVATVSHQGALTAQMVKLGNLLMVESLSCAAEKLEMCVSAAFAVPEVNALIERARQLTAYLLYDEEARRVLHETQESEGLSRDLQLVEDSKDSWVTTSEMLFKLVALRGVVEKVCDLDIKNTHVLLDETAWDLAEKLVNSMQILRAALSVMSKEKSGSISCLLPVVHSILQHCEDANHAQNTPLEKFLKTIGKETREKWDLTAILPSSVSMVAALLDPRFKRLKFIAEEDKADVLDALDVILASSKKVDGERHASHSDAQETSPFLCLFGGSEEDGQDRNESDTEVSSYMACPTLRHDICPLDWWRINKSRFPRLAVLAQQFLCVPAVTQPPSNVTGASKVDMKRALLDVQCAAQLIFMNHNWDLTFS